MKKITSLGVALALALTGLASIGVVIANAVNTEAEGIWYGQTQTVTVAYTASTKALTATVFANAGSGADLTNSATNVQNEITASSGLLVADLTESFDNVKDALNDYTDSLVTKANVGDVFGTTQSIANKVNTALTAFNNSDLNADGVTVVAALKDGDLASLAPEADALGTSLSLFNEGTTSATTNSWNGNGDATLSITKIRDAFFAYANAPRVKWENGTPEETKYTVALPGDLTKTVATFNVSATVTAADATQTVVSPSISFENFAPVDLVSIAGSASIAPADPSITTAQVVNAKLVVAATETADATSAPTSTVIPVTITSGGVTSTIGGVVVNYVENYTNAISGVSSIGDAQTVTLTASHPSTWTTSNAAIATVDANGKIVAKKAGTVTIKATSKDLGNQATKVISVKALTISGAKITGTLKVGKTITAAGTVNNGGKLTYKWTSKKSPATKTLKLDKGDKKKTVKVVITAKKTGFKTVTKTITSGKIK
jgi:hypothetical protein